MIRTLCVTAFTSVALSMTMQAHAAAPSTAQGAALPAGTLAIVNGVPIPLSQFDDALHASHQQDTPQVRQQIKRDLIVRELLRQGAEKHGYDTKPEVQAAINVAKVNAATQLYVKDSLHPEAVTDAQVKARYDGIVASLGKEEYRPRIISVADDATARAVLAKLKAGSPFEALARAYSVAASKATGGEMPWVSFKTPVTDGNTQGLPLPVAQAITQLPAGAVTLTAIPVTQGNSTLYVIVKLDAKRPTQVPAFDQMKDTIRQQLQVIAVEKASVQFVSDQLKGASIQQ
ncbi:peptidyl-prolyl cis-trans isomerase [Paraburkholderia aspalathi]|uniref:peptidylprolyl isomerase n=1 Tax=Paraburkholderia nemoris TaxID=2793076 RepID=UPI00190E3820|nr:peptidylprolyl isomerase [Paraburkholderia nemoris]MBK3786706.1 peptidyl-prolyl cis-trans isomerase [Paraburkholderia aspalathi]